jgi:TPR repeat protein
MNEHRLIALGLLAVAAVATPTAAQVTKNTPPPPLAPNAAANVESSIDLAYGAFQRGHYLTAFNEATKRAQQNDPAAMTLLGEIYAQGLGVGRDDSKAAQWYKLAAAKGGRDALFALAMFNFQGRAGTQNLEEAARLLDAAAKLGHAGAAYDLGLLYLQGQQFSQDFKRASELFAAAAEAGNSEAQYALATMYKEGRGVQKDMSKAMRLMQQASVAGNLDAMVEFAIAQFNGEGINKDEPAAAQLFLKAAHLGSPIAQNRLARIRMAGRGMPADATEAVKWHMVAKAGGASDPELDIFAGKQTPAVREAADKAAKKWLSTVAAARP